MRMNRIAVVPATALLAVSALSACGSDDKATDAASNAAGSAKSAGASATDSASAAGSSATDKASAGASSSSTSSNASNGTQCPTEENTKKFAKTRFAADVGLAAGTFKHWVYDPYKSGSFDKNRKGGIDKTDAIKAGLVVAADYKLLKNAKDNAMASPALCNAIGKPLDEALEKLKNVDKTQLLAGNVGGLMGAQTALQSVISGSKSQGTDVQETTDVTKSDVFDGATKKLLGAAN